MLEKYKEAEAIAARDAAMLLTDRGATFPEDMTFEDWFETGRQIYYTYSKSLLWLGDWINFGRDRFGDKKKYGTKYREALELSGYDQQTLRNASWVAGKVHLSRRRDNLSAQHHFEVAPLEPKDQTKFLKQAEEKGWSRVELRRAIRSDGAEGTADTCSDRRQVFSPFETLRDVLRWFRTEVNEKPISTWTAERRAMVKKELQPLVEIYEQL